jgi:arylsulfatase A-like enzyme
MMNRRQFLTISTAALLSPRTGASADKPNILFILADDLGYGDLGCYGQKRILTPNLDRLASEGIRFTQAYSGSTVCAPSRGSLMTGLHTGHATIRGNKKPEAGIRPDETTVASLLKQAGYRTAIFGKWGMGGPGTGSVPNTRGFDAFYGYLDQQHAHNYYPEHLWDNQNEVFLTNNWFDRRKDYAPDLFTRHALDFIKAPSEKPFFLYLTTTIPHADNELTRVKGHGMEVPSDQPYSDRDWPQPEKNFAAMITRMDADVGRILEQLKESGLDRDTIVVFTSDNGPHKEGGHDPDFFRSSGPLRGIKRDLYEGGIRVPFIVRWPGKVVAGRTSDHVIAFWDFLPTAAEIAGVKAPSGLDGISYLPELLGKPQAEHQYLYWEFHERGFTQAIRMGDWKGVRLDVGAPIELYNLTTDLAEKENVAAAHPDVVAKIDALLKSSRTDSKEFPIRPLKK